MSLTARQARTISASVESWFAKHARDLPWRRRRNGYTALVAEAMLQQTQVPRITDAFKQFVRKFPTIKALAASDEQSVLAAWRGLGYYRRARNLHRAAKAICERHGGRVPAELADLLHLPGVGRYTAGAISSIVYGKRVPIVDANVSRVVLRVLGKRANAEESATRELIWQTAESLVQYSRNPSQCNEGLMELGSLVCTRIRPKCEVCPLARSCRARREGLERSIPKAKRPGHRKVVHHHSVIVRRGGLILLNQRPAEGLWSNMWQAPTVESERRLSTAAVLQRLGLPLRNLRHCGRFHHPTSHRRVIFHVFRAETRGRRGVWRCPDDLGDLPLGSPHKRIFEDFLRA